MTFLRSLKKFSVDYIANLGETSPRYEIEIEMRTLSRMAPSNIWYWRCLLFERISVECVSVRSEFARFPRLVIALQQIHAAELCEIYMRIIIVAHPTFFRICLEVNFCTFLAGYLRWYNTRPLCDTSIVIRLSNLFVQLVCSMLCTTFAWIKLFHRNCVAWKITRKLHF